MKSATFLKLFDHALVAVLIVVLSGAYLGRQVWLAKPAALLAPLLFAGAYATAGFAVEWLAARERRLGTVGAALVGFAAFGVAFVALLLAEMRIPALLKVEAPRLVSLTAVAVGVPALVLLNLAHGAMKAGKAAFLLPALLAGAVLAAQLGVTRIGGKAAEEGTGKPSQEVSFLDTSLYVLKVTTYRDSLPGAAERGGAISALNDGYLVAAGNGGIYFAQEADDRRSLVARKLAHTVPFNPDEFLGGARKIFGESWKGDHHLEKVAHR